MLDIDEEAAAATASIAAELGVHGDRRRASTSATRRRWSRRPSTCATTLGGCDVLCSNVGVQQFGAVDKLTEQDWQWVLNVNVLGTIRTVREFLPMLRARERVPPHRVHRVVERARAVGAPRRVPDDASSR